VYHIHFPPHKPEKGIAPEKNEHYIHKQPVGAVPFRYMHHFMCKYFFPRIRVHVNIPVPENITEKGKWRTLSFCLHNIDLLYLL
jgi:hypothetical protein